MHSLKQTAVAVILLGLTYGLYQVSLTPSESAPKSAPFESSQSPMTPAPAKTDLSLPSTDHSLNKNTTANPSETKLSAANLPEIKLPETNLSSSAPPGLKGIEVPRMPELPSSPSLSIPDMKSPAEKSPPPRSADLSGNDLRSGLLAESLAPNNRSTNADSDANSGRKPVETVIENGMEQIKYPDMPASESRSSQIAQREPSAASRDQGLIDVLNTQVPISQPKDASLVSSQGANQFVATPPSNTLVKTPVSGDFQPDSGTVKENAGTTAAESGSQPVPTSKPATRNRISQAELEKLTYKTVWPKVDELVEAGDFYSALKALSRFYKDESLNGPQRQRLMAWMDALAAKVIFSSEDHLADQPYVTQPNESLSDISNRWSVPMKLISNINGSNLANLNALPAGTQLKQVQGPFHAELKLNAGVITLFLDGLYAGRFSVVLGTAGDISPGTYEVVLKSEQGFTWRDQNGKDHAPGTPENGYGPWWMGLSKSLCIHAVPEKTENGHRGCIGLSEKDAMDLFSILSEKSTLVIVP